MDRSILINKENKIKNNYLHNVELQEINNIYNEKVLIDKQTLEAYLELEKYLKEVNIEIGIISTYRTFAEQDSLLLKAREKYSEEIVDKYLEPSTYSEHHTSLAIDISVKKDSKFLNFEEMLENDELMHQVHEVLSKFGFILRYPKKKEKETYHNYIPWHIRYVGKYIANILDENNLSLEEYKKYFQGVIILNKEKDYTSYDVVKILQHLFGIRKIGHTGTLDPLAEGVLIICIGNATKIEELITAEDKEYIAEVKLGIKTDTYDILGNIIEEKDYLPITNLKEKLQKFKRTYMQEVPKYSAVKVNGKKLYEYARANIEVELPKKEVTIKEIELLEEKTDSFKFRTVVSKGCYIRSLINDISNELNVPMTMTSLLRTRQGKAKLSDSYTLKDIKENKFKMYSVEDIVNFDIVTLNKEDAFKVANGVPISNKWNIKDKVLFKAEDNHLLGIYQNKNSKLMVWKNFWN